MSELDETIRLSGRTVTIVRSGGNVSTYMVDDELGRLPGKGKPDPYYDFEVGMIFPSDSTLSEGDLILADSDYFLAMSVAEKRLWGALQAYRGMLYKCNSEVSIYEYNAVSKKHDTLVKAGVRSLITQVRALSERDDKDVVIKGYRGKRQPFQLFMRNSEGLTNESIVVDQDGRRFRVHKQFDVFIAAGIVQAKVLWEN